MRLRFLPSYYAHELLKNATFSARFPICRGLLPGGLLGKNDAAMARFRSGLHHEIQDILDHKEYAHMTILLEYVCQAESEV
jgi:hypothetical protein